MATKKDALPKDWRAGVKKLITEYSTDLPAGFTGRDPISRATLPEPDVHRREMDKKALTAVARKSSQILESDDATEAAAALLNAEMRERRKASNDVYPDTWRRALAYGIMHVTRLSMEKQAEGAWRISAEEAKRTASALRVVRRNAGWCLIQDPDGIDEEIEYFESSIHSAPGQRESRTTHAIITLARMHQVMVHDPVHVATAALIRASFGGEMSNDSVRSIVHRNLKKSKSDE